DQLNQQGKEILLIKFNNFVEKYVQQVQQQKKEMIESILRKNKGKLDRDIEGFVFKPEVHLKHI
ncbi:MAG TPA: hypothetical protein VHJ38_08250, partial [Nitrososphaeraceae archaeon]|nr:hypothetical protein [Nitrososphaeraceae archaeon]